MTKVFAPQCPSRFDRATSLWVPTVNLAPAEKHGEVVVVLPPEASRLHVAPLIAAIRERMETFEDGDYVIAVGDPTILSAVAVLAARKSGGTLRMLKWDRLSSDYVATEMKL